MEETGITRIPYYPELKCLNRGNIRGDITALVMSVMLYWNSLEKCIRFNARSHLELLSINLKERKEDIRESMEYLCSIGILEKETETIRTQSLQESKKIKFNEFYTLNFHVLKETLLRHGCNIPVKILKMASDDYFDIYAYISPRRLPVIQGVFGMVKGEFYEKAAVSVCQILCGICSDKRYEEFSVKALAQGWRILAQPPVSAEELAARYLRAGERSVDVDLTDGSFFLPDGNCFGTQTHRIWHCAKTAEPKILAGSLYLCFCTICPDLKFYSDLTVAELEPAIRLLYEFTGLKAVLTDRYFFYRELTGRELADEQLRYQQILENL